MSEITNTTLKQLYYSMLRIRRAEEAVAERYPGQEIRCPTHLCIGQEAVSAGVCAVLNPKDTVFSNHRGHGHYLAKGGDLTGMIAELYGRSGGCAGGYGGSMHLADPKAGFMGSAPIVGGTLPLAVGMAWAFSLKKQPHVSVAFFGDGCFEEGIMHECLNFAALRKIPVLFVCENNSLSVFTGLAERQPKRPIHGVVRAHGWDSHAGNGNDALEVYELARAAAERLRRGEGPQFLEFKTDRWMEHCGPHNDDHLGYRPPATNGANRCPLTNLRLKLLKEGWSEAEFEAMENAVKKEVEKAFVDALKSPPPRGIHLSRKVYAG